MQRADTFLVSANFKRLLPLAAQHNSRVIALNRRDYPGSAPYTAEERATLARLATASPDTASERGEEAMMFMRERGGEVYDYVLDLVKRDRIPPVHGDGQSTKGGIVIAGWSLGAIWALAFIAHASSFSDSDVNLSQYVRRVVLHGMRLLPCSESSSR